VSSYHVYHFKFSVSQSHICHDFIAGHDWLRIHLTSGHWIIRFGGNIGVLSDATIETKTVPEFEDALQLMWSALAEKPLAMLWKTTASNCMHVCQPVVDIFFTYNVIIHITDASNYF